MNHLVPRMKSPFYVNFFNIPLKLLTLSAQRGGVMSGEFLTGFVASHGNNSASTRARIFLPRSPSLILRNDITRFITYKCTRYARSNEKLPIDAATVLSKNVVSAANSQNAHEGERDRKKKSLFGDSREFEKRVINLGNAIYRKVSCNYAEKRVTREGNYVYVKSCTKRYCTQISCVTSTL